MTNSFRKRVERRVRPLKRKVSSHWGVLPHFIIVGAQRSGTTTLYNLMAQHPNIVAAARKEAHYFDLNYWRDLGWYRSHFPSQLSLKGGTNITGESSPYYLFHPEAAERVAQLLPAVKLIAILRNPTDRAYSQHAYNVKVGREPLAFKDAMAQETNRLTGEVEKIRESAEYKPFSHQHFSYLSRGHYFEQIEQWLQHFGRDQLLILNSDLLFNDPNSILAQITQFLGLGAYTITQSIRLNSTQGQPMPDAIRQQLDDYFAPYNRRLFDFIGDNWGWAV